MDSTPSVPILPVQKDLVHFSVVEDGTKRYGRFILPRGDIAVQSLVDHVVRIYDCYEIIIWYMDNKGRWTVMGDEIDVECMMQCHKGTGRAADPIELCMRGIREDNDTITKTFSPSSLVFTVGA